MKEFLRTVKYTLIAGSAGIIQFGSYALFYELLGIAEWVSYILSLCLSVIWNFTINRKETFKSNENYGKAMLKVVGYYCVFAPLSTWWTAKLVFIGWNNYLVEILTMLVNFITEFLFMRFVVFGSSIDSAINGNKDNTQKDNAQS